MSAVDADESDDYFMAVTDFIAPTRLFLGTIVAAHGDAEAATGVFRRQRLTVSQHEAVSKDGTSIPYFEVARANLALKRKEPDAPLRLRRVRGRDDPEYSGTLGAGWL